ncbi:MAG: YtxH domain-containing protein [Bacteroidales bacterium]|nr:YtxH domain-containing protein [Bacteroidales bacterium]
MSTGKLVLGIVAGVATGALLGVLFAPEKGATTRKRICRKGEDLTDDLKEKIDELVSNIAKKFDQVKKDVTDFAEKAMEKEEKEEEDLTAKDLKATKH